MTLEALYEVYLSSPRVSTDTRKDPANSLFFCLKGPSFDANTFAEKAIELGAILVVSDDPQNARIDGVVIVDDVLKSLQNLAAHHRKQFNFPVIGLTGSNGKTTNKELIAAVLSKKYRTYATRGNLNNHIGVPLTLLEIPLNAEIAIIEMGANHQGEIRALSQISDPNYGMITNIGKAHLEGFGGIEGVKKGKKELYDHLGKKARTVFVNHDDPVLVELSSKNQIVYFGTKGELNLTGKLISHSPQVSFEFEDSEGSSGEITTHMVGSYNFYNLLAAACIGRYFKVPHADIKLALEAYVPANNRSQIVKTANNQVLLDAYNANPTSMEAALRNFAEMEANNKIALLGQMLELGDSTHEEHQNLINLVRSLSIHTFLVGPYFKECEKFDLPHFETTEELGLHLKSEPLKNSLVLLKGSRMMAMEKILPEL